MEKPLHTEEAKENPCKELWYENRVKELAPQARVEILEYESAKGYPKR